MRWGALPGRLHARTRARSAADSGAVREAYRKSNKNDFLDAEAIAEAVTRQNMRFVPIKTEEQLDLQALHRVRDRLVQRRTALINQIRGFLLERGITFASEAHSTCARTCRRCWKMPSRT